MSVGTGVIGIVAGMIGYIALIGGVSIFAVVIGYISAGWLRGNRAAGG